MRLRRLSTGECRQLSEISLKRFCTIPSSNPIFIMYITYIDDLMTSTVARLDERGRSQKLNEGDGAHVYLRLTFPSNVHYEGCPGTSYEQIRIQQLTQFTSLLVLARMM
ncbi:hypothetical protein Q1695_012626 [Nippostrongylus brasiliensis]|nr:hypothetical protein Q1695_012626 [Nippostrongylus brasiliensis]